MEFDDFGDLFGDEELNNEDRKEEKSDFEKANSSSKAKDLEAVWEKTEDESKMKKRMRRPIPKLSERELTSEKGIGALKASFDNYTFPSGSDPYQKLDLLLNKMECWAHFLFPKMNFDDCLDKIEKLRHKRPVTAAMRRLRYGDVFDYNNSEENVENKIDLLEEEINEDEHKNEEMPSHRKAAEDNEEDGEEDDDQLDKFLDSLKTPQNESSKQNEGPNAIESDDNDDSEIGVPIIKTSEKGRYSDED